MIFRGEFHTCRDFKSCFVCHAVGIYLGMTQDSPLKVWKIHAMKPNCRGQESFFHFTSPPSSLIFISLMAKFHIDGAEKRFSHGCLGQNPTNCSWIFHERWICLIEVLTIKQVFETKYIFSSYFFLARFKPHINPETGLPNSLDLKRPRPFPLHPIWMFEL